MPGSLIKRRNMNRRASLERTELTTHSETLAVVKALKVTNLSLALPALSLKTTRQHSASQHAHSPVILSSISFFFSPLLKSKAKIISWRRVYSYKCKYLWMFIRDLCQCVAGVTENSNFKDRQLSVKETSKWRENNTSFRRGNRYVQQKCFFLLFFVRKFNSNECISFNHVIINWID